MGQLTEWAADKRALVAVDVTAPGAWDDFVSSYAGSRAVPALRRVVEIAQQHGVKSVLVERRYIDLDWRSEHAEFYATTFERYPSICHRAHFFTDALPEDLGDLSALSDAYRGYTILRPVPRSPVGRTMIAPPPELDDAFRCEAVEVVDVLGWPMEVRSMPFVSQDGEYLRCAHAAMWMVLYHAHLRQRLPRRVPKVIHDAAMGGVINSRQVPSDGLSIYQMLGALTDLELSPALLPLDGPAKPGLGLYEVMARYVNSNIAPIVVSDSHAWLISAYSRVPSAGSPKVTIYRHDDAFGPYIRIDDPASEPHDAHKAWRYSILPLPPKIYMTAERAEAVGTWFMTTALNSPTPPAALSDAAKEKELTYLAYGLSSRDYKHGLLDRPSFSPDLAREYRLSQWPKNLWVVEAIDRRLRGQIPGAPCVLGEVIIDPTAFHDPSAVDNGILATHVEGSYHAVTPDYGVSRDLVVPFVPYESGRPRLS